MVRSGLFYIQAATVSWSWPTMSFQVHNEQTRLTASWLSDLAIALVAAGVFAPAIAFLYGISQPVPGGIQISAVTIACIGGGVFLHLFGRHTLGRLRE
jgi:hypothetical protein